jgi:D-alanyl-lipoteichoic acid acyltransferase DltB (MBOAT superfamily)
VERRNGVPLGSPGSLLEMLRRSLGSHTFDGFWRHWNPIWGYYLGRYVNAPLRRVMPPDLSVILTFIVSGLIHDLAISLVAGSPIVLFVPWFALVGPMVVIGRRFGLRYGFRVWSVRAVINMGLVGSQFGIVTIGSTSSVSPDRWQRSVSVGVRTG